MSKENSAAPFDLPAAAGLNLSVPGKTFLVGEYLALEGGPAIVLATAPRFVLLARARHHTGSQPFHPESPAGLFLARHPQLAQRYDFDFRDPHHKKGGLGASSAQFVLLYALATGLRNFHWQDLLAEYRAVAWNGVGSAPSGFDVVAQANGGVTWFDGRTCEAQTLEWSFPSLSFTLMRTGAKLATHEHLRSAKAAPHEELRSIVSEATKAFATKDEALLIQSVQAYASVLGRAGFTAAGTSSLLQRMRLKPDLFFAMKGCGAMGADVVLTLHSRARTSDVAEWARSEGLQTCGVLDDLTMGLDVRIVAENSN